MVADLISKHDELYLKAISRGLPLKATNKELESLARQKNYLFGNVLWKETTTKETKTGMQGITLLDRLNGSIYCYIKRNSSNNYALDFFLEGQINSIEETHLVHHRD